MLPPAIEVIEGQPLRLAFVVSKLFRYTAICARNCTVFVVSNLESARKRHFSTVRRAHTPEVWSQGINLPGGECEMRS